MSNTAPRLSTLVSEYEPRGSAAEIAFQYPFAVPEHSFITDGVEVRQLPDSLANFTAEADALLEVAGVPKLAARVPVIAYGANVNPSRFHDKMASYGQSPGDEQLQVAPMLRVQVPDTEVVWHGKPAQAGSVFAELYRAEDSKGESAECMVQFLTNEQIAMLHATEGVTYHFTPLTVQDNEGNPFQAVAYVAGESLVLLKDGKPVRVTRPGQQGSPEQMTAYQAVRYMLDNAGYVLGMRSPEALFASNVGIPLAEKKAKQAAVAVELGELGLSQAFSFEKPGGSFGRADFNAIHTIGHTPKTLELAEQSLVRLRPSREKVQALTDELIASGVEPKLALSRARRKLDIIEAIRSRATAEIEERLRDSNT